MENQKERDGLYGKGIKNLRFRTLNGKIKFGIHDLETKHEGLVKLEEIAKKAEALELDEEEVLAEVAANLNLLKKKEVRVQEQLENDIRADKGKKIEVESQSELPDIDNDDETAERQPAIEQALSPEEEMALERFRDYEKRLVS